MSWIKTIGLRESTGRLRALYERIKGQDDCLDNIVKVHGLRPHTLEGHMALYKSVLHHAANRLPRWFLETLGVYVSLLNSCEYCVRHHYHGLRRLLADPGRADAIRDALTSESFGDVFELREQAALRYAAALTETPAQCDEVLIRALRDAGYDDGEILEINQVVAYFAYANRTVLGLGVSLQGDVLGLSPADSDRPDDWRHR